MVKGGGDWGSRVLNEVVVVLVGGVVTEACQITTGRGRQIIRA